MGGLAALVGVVAALVGVVAALVEVVAGVVVLAEVLAVVVVIAVVGHDGTNHTRDNLHEGPEHIWLQRLSSRLWINGFLCCFEGPVVICSTLVG